MRMFDRQIAITDRNILDRYLNGYPHRTSGLSFTSLYMWRDINQFSYDIIDGYLCISGVSHLELETGTVLPFMFPPLAGDGVYEKEALAGVICRCREIFRSKGYPFSLRLVPENMTGIISDACPEIVFREDRPNYDYIYLTQDLIGLKGKPYHSKRNHLNYFRRNFGYEYVQLTPEMADSAMEFISEFNSRKDIPANEMELLRMEEKAMEDVFRNIDRTGCMAGAIRMDGKIEAVAIGGLLGSDTVVEHIEKANTRYRGLYQAITNEFCRHLPENAVYLNREEDMGIENLRKAKLSYRPVELLAKYIGVFE